jgi:maltoporin
MKKVSLIAAAVASTLAAGTAFAAGTDVVSDGWEVHGYMSSNARMANGTTVDTEYGRPDYKTAGTHGQSTNQVEFVINKKTTYESGVWANYLVRSEFGNGNSLAYSSDGSQIVDDNDGFAVKEAFVELGGIFENQDTSIWAGQRYLNRSAGILSGEFWKQSSGVGAGLQTKLNGKTAGTAFVMADPTANAGDAAAARTTLSSLDFYYYGVDSGMGSLDFDMKIGNQELDGENDSGFGASVTLNSSYYGFDGWTQNAIAYGSGVMQNRGVNFGSWSGGNEDAESLFLTSYGVLNISDKIQMGSEFTYFKALDQLFTAEGLVRYLVAVRPSYKVNDNIRLESTLSYAHEEGDEGYWGRTGDDMESNITNVELAVAFTANSDYFGRPQIKPYISYIKADDEASAQIIGIESGTNETVVGVHTEIWF